VGLGVGTQQCQLEHVHAVIEAEGERVGIEQTAVGDEDALQPAPVAEGQDVAEVVAQQWLAAGEGDQPAVGLML